MITTRHVTPATSTCVALHFDSLAVVDEPPFMHNIMTLYCIADLCADLELPHSLEIVVLCFVALGQTQPWSLRYDHYSPCDPGDIYVCGAPQLRSADGTTVGWSMMGVYKPYKTDADGRWEYIKPYHFGVQQAIFHLYSLGGTYSLPLLSSARA